MPLHVHSDGLVYEKFYSDEDGFDFDKMMAWIISGTVAGSSTEDPTHKGSMVASSPSTTHLIKV